MVDGGWLMVDGFQKGSLILLKILSDQVSNKCDVTFFIGRKSDFKFEISDFWFKIPLVRPF